MQLKNLTVDFYFEGLPSNLRKSAIPQSIASELVEITVGAAQTADVEILAKLASSELAGSVSQPPEAFRIKTRQAVARADRFNALCSALEHRANVSINGHTPNLLLAWKLSAQSRCPVSFLLSEGNLIFSSLITILQPQTDSGGNKNDLPHHIEADVMNDKSKGGNRPKPFDASSGLSKSEWLVYRDELAAFKADYASGKIPAASKEDLVRVLSNTTQPKRLEI